MHRRTQPAAWCFTLILTPFHYALQTPYAFVLYDHSQGRIFAARDAEVQQSLEMLVE